MTENELLLAMTEIADSRRFGSLTMTKSDPENGKYYAENDSGRRFVFVTEKFPLPGGKKLSECLRVIFRDDFWFWGQQESPLAPASFEGMLTEVRQVPTPDLKTQNRVVNPEGKGRREKFGVK